MKCQVIEKTEYWPYVAPCRDEAKHQILQRCRQDHPEIDVEYICEGHHDIFCEAFGYNNDYVKPLPQE